MKTISAALDTHLNREVTTLCTCWKIVRQDGEVFAFTDHDNDLVFEGLTYESETGYTRTAISSDSSMSVDNLDVRGFLESDRISENDLRNGLFDRAKVYIFALNWDDPSQGALKLRRGWFGEVVLADNGEFETEIRGLHQALGHNFMESFTPECRTDFCSTKCKLSLNNFKRTGRIWQVTNRSQFRLTNFVGDIDPNTVGAHRYWGLFATQGNEAMSISEFRLFDQTNADIPGGTAFATTTFNGNSGPQLARDGNPGTIYHSAVGQVAGQFLWVDFGADNAKDVKSFSVRSRPDGWAHQTPTGFNLVYSDDGIVWSVAKEVFTTAWSVGETRIFSGFGMPLIPMPEASNGVGTYVGGMIKMTSGQNAGKVMEIIGWEQSTGTLVAFENFPYPIETGETFELTQGCDKRFATCKLYDNQANFRGEPHVPGQDEYMKYPDAK